MLVMRMEALGLHGGIVNLIVRREIVGVRAHTYISLNVVIYWVRRPSIGAGLKLHAEKNEGVLYLLDFLSFPFRGVVWRGVKFFYLL